VSKLKIGSQFAESRRLAVVQREKHPGGWPHCPSHAGMCLTGGSCSRSEQLAVLCPTDARDISLVVIDAVLVIVAA
jgi:hypothetical protein